jgi:hypothetical protein
MDKRDVTRGRISFRPFSGYSQLELDDYLNLFRYRDTDWSLVYEKEIVFNNIILYSVLQIVIMEGETYEL